ncbi:helicase-exonuclease AddAB subunit AddA [Megasphaera sp. UBA4382]|uniref:helicase-exonuclease AddAB subunit AddA n=1 Tax=Megasphaera sp. UBA4382 TaxID=1946850 RepID=UPI0025BEBF2B|nr:helicase-exonuclease AddAB subunit AddA [Megasphaera sp. UBA4382]
MAWTHEQQEAINSRGQTLLLSAAAGSGKTAVLVERIIRRLLDQIAPVDITEMLVVTFTKAAAAEMRERIAAALASKLTEEDSERAERQLALMPSAHISTLHSFCQAVIRRYFYKIDVDPRFTIAGTEELILLQHQVLEDVFLSYYEDPDKAQILYPLAEMFGDEHGDDILMEEIIRIYHFSRSLPWPDAWLDKAVADYAVADDARLDDLPWCQPIKKRAHSQISSILERLRQILPGLEARPALEKGYQQIQNEYVMLQSIQDKTSWEELRQAVRAVNYDRLASLRKLDEDDKEFWEQCKKVRTSCKKQFTAMRDMWFVPSGRDWLDGLRSMEPYITGLVQLTKDFAEAYGQAKKEKSWVDFNDLEHFCLQILLDPVSTPEHIIRSDAAEELRHTFKEILMDEYQDTNGVQEMIARLIACPDNRFMVGDIKQSIYRFRLADPTLFLEKYRAYSRDDRAEQRCIDLARNFRSDRHILEAINDVFSRIMTTETAGMPYGERERLYAGRKECTDDSWLGGTVEVRLLDTGGSDDTGAEDDQPSELVSDELAGDGEDERTAFEKECQMVARCLIDMKHSGQCIQRKDSSMEPVSWRHMVVLLRSLKNKAQVMARIFQEAGIPVYADESGGYFAAIEVQVMLALLRCIDNPEQDLPMAAVLRSPLVKMDESALACLHLTGDGTLWQKLPAYVQTLSDEDATPLRDFMRHLEQWRTFSRRASVAELLQRLYEDTGYIHFVGGMPGGAVRQANLRALYERARQYEEAGYRGLFRYLQLIDKMQEDELDLAPAKVLGEGEDVVRIISIHKSKGLEFPVVVVADMGKQFNETDISKDILLHKSLGIGLRQFDTEWRISYPDFIWSGLREQLAWEGRAEEQRVLYVAMTRARDKLILTGTVKDMGKAWKHWQKEGSPSEGKSYLDWLMPLFAGADQWKQTNEKVMAGLESDEMHGLWRLALYHQIPTLEEVAPDISLDSPLQQVRRGEPVGALIPGWMEQTLSWHYPWPKATGTAAKYSVSEIKRQYQLQHQDEWEEERELAATGAGADREEDVFGRLPAWMDGREEEETGARRGTIVHKIMQYLDIRADMNRNDIDAQLRSWQAQELFTAEEVSMAYLPPILAFCHSPLSRRMASSDRILREYPFSILLPAGGLLPDAEPGEEILVQGVIDCLFREGDGWVLIDYKTDRLDDADAFIKRYGVQISLYRQAVEKISGRPVREAYMYSFRLGTAIRVE